MNHKKCFTEMWSFTKESAKRINKKTLEEDLNQHEKITLYFRSKQIVDHSCFLKIYIYEKDMGRMLELMRKNTIHFLNCH